MQLVEKVSQHIEAFKDVKDEDSYIKWVRTWKRLHESVVDIIMHHKTVNLWHRDEWRSRRERIEQGLNRHGSFAYAFSDDRIDAGAQRNNQRWKDIYGNVASQMYEYRAAGKTFIRGYLNDHPSRYDRTVVKDQAVS